MIRLRSHVRRYVRGHVRPFVRRYVRLSVTALGITQTAVNASRAAELERELSLKPRDARVYLELAREYERAGESRRAEATLRAGMNNAWEVRQLRYATVDFLVRAERWDDAIVDALPLAVDSSGRSLVGRLRVNSGLAAYRAGDRGRARAAWEAALASDSTLVEGAMNLTAVLRELGKRDSARAVASRALRMHPADSRLLALRASTIEGSAGLAATLKALRQRRAERPDDEASGLELAGLLAASGNRMAAMVLYDTLVRAPNASEAAVGVAVEFFMDGGQSKTAAVLADSALAKFPRSSKLNALLGEAAAVNSEWPRSADAYRRAIRFTREREPLELALLDVYVSGADTTRALTLASNMAARPASRLALLQVARRGAELRAPALADSIYLHLISEDSTDSEALEAAGALAESVGDTAKAISLYQRGVALDSSGPASPLSILRLTHPSADSTRLLLRRAIWRGMETLQNLELSGVAASSGRLTLRSAKNARPNADRRQQTLALLRSALDTVVLHTSWGRTELSQLRLAYPHSALLERYVADVAATGGSDSLALAGYDRLLRRDAANAEVQRERAALLERMGRGRTAEAIDGYARALDLEPENERTFRTLAELRQRQGTLDALLGQIRRLRQRLPDSRLLGDHEVEILQRLGRLAEAQRVANELAKRKP